MAQKLPEAVLIEDVEGYLATHDAQQALMQQQQLIRQYNQVEESLAARLQR